MRRTARVAFALLIAVLAFFLARGTNAGAQAQSQTNVWIWQNGNPLHEETSVTGVYGLLGVASAANTPPGRDSSTTWTDSAGNLWLFGGAPGGSTLAAGPSRNDLWKFDPASAEWTWVSGTSNDVALPGTYGQLGVPSPANVPGSRAGGVSWTDRSDNLWLFGGSGYDSMGNLGVLDDLWKFDPATAEWTWVGGKDTIPVSSSQCVPGSYGTRGTASAENLPGGRAYGGAWTDSSGVFWLFGGEGCGGSGGQAVLNDLWSYSPATGEWTWVGGSTTGYVAGAYDTLGDESSSSVPGSRYMAANWTDSAGEFWMFGGFGVDYSGTLGYLNDLWRFDPAGQQWAWISGSYAIGDEDCQASSRSIGCSRPGVYGILGQPSVDNTPGGRVYAVGAAVGNGSFLLFGGSDQAGDTDHSSRFTNEFSDLWQFNPRTSEWAWIGGGDAMVCGASSQGICLADGISGIYGTRGTGAVTNYPGSREGHVSWADQAGNFWIFGGDGFDSAGLNPQLNDIWEYRVSPLATASPVTVTLTSSSNPVFTQNAVALTAVVASAAGGAAVPTGTVTFVEGTANNAATVQLGSATLNASGGATLRLASLPTGTFTIQANYSGDVSNASGSSADLTQLVGDFSIVANTPVTATISSGGTATFELTVTPVGPISVFPATIAFKPSGGLAAAAYVFTPVSIASGAGTAHVTFTVTLPPQAAASASHSGWPELPVIPLALASLMLPFAWSSGRRKNGKYRVLPAVLLVLAGAGGALALGGCGNKFYTLIPSPSPPKPPATPVAQTYTITVTGSSGPLNHSTTVTLTVD